MDIAEFLTARLDDDEAVALGATPGTWRDSSVDGNRFAALVADTPHPERRNPDKGGWGWDAGYGGCLVGESLMSKDRVHIARHNPARVLADVAAKRRIVEEVQSWKHTVSEDCWYTCPAATEEVEGDTCCHEAAGTDCDCGRDWKVDRMLKLLASVWREHPDWRPEWVVS